MTVTRLARIILALFSSSSIAAAVGVDRPVAINETQTLIAALTNDSFAVREHAQSELTETGESALKLLRAALSRSADEEQRARIESILKQIGEDTVLGPSRVTLDLTDAPLEEAISEINRQVHGAPISYPRENWQNIPGPTVTIHVRRQPLWAVLRELCEQAGTLDIVPSDDGIRLSLGCGALTRAPAAVSGPLLIVASRITHQNSIEFTQGAHRNSEFVVHLSAIAEPKLKIMPGPATLRLTTATDDRGNSLLPVGAADESYGGSSPFWSFQTRLRYPDAPGATIARLAGHVTFNAASRFETIELSDLTSARNIATEIGNFKFIIRQVAQTNDRYEVTLAAVAPAGEPDEFNRLQKLLYSADPRLLDGDGHAILRSAGPNFTPAEQSNMIELTVIFDRAISNGRPMPGAARKLVWQIPVESKPITVQFELKNLPMP